MPRQKRHSGNSKRKIREEIRRWKVYKRSHLSIFEIADFRNPKIRGWIGYYGKFYRFELYDVFKQFNTGLLHWARRKYKKIGGGKRRAVRWLETLAASHPNLFEQSNPLVGFRGVAAHKRARTLNLF